MVNAQDGPASPPREQAEALIMDDCVAPAGRMLQMSISWPGQRGRWLASVFAPKRGRWLASLYDIRQGAPILDVTISFHDRSVGQARKFNDVDASQVFRLAEAINRALEPTTGPYSL